MTPTAHLVTIARQGSFKVEKLVLLPSAFRQLKKEGLELIKLGTKNGARNKVFVTSINWEHAYSEGIPVAVSEFISGKSKDFPNEDVSNLAQKLFVLSSVSKK